MSASLQDVLHALCQTPPTSYLQRLPTGLTTLQTLYDHAAEAGLVPSSANDDIARLHALFDVALDHGMGSLVRDYVTEVRLSLMAPMGSSSRQSPFVRSVAAACRSRSLAALCGLLLPRVQVCSNRALTSSDPLEAFLLDGECVRRWVQKQLLVAQRRAAIDAETATSAVHARAPPAPTPAADVALARAAADAAVAGLRGAFTEEEPLLRCMSALGSAALIDAAAARAAGAEAALAVALAKAPASSALRECAAEVRSVLGGRA